MALATLHLAAIPFLASLAAGTGVVATYVAVPATPAIEAAAAPDCSAQAWPYADRTCVADAGLATGRKVRVVTAPRPGEAFAVRWAEVPAPPVAAPAGFTTSDGVLRAPQNPEAIPDAPVTTPKAKRHEVKREKRTHEASRVATQPYQAPAERSDETREVTVIRPLRYD
jgi:hypothetical protein